MLIADGTLEWPLLPEGVPEGYDPDRWAEAVSIAVEWLWRNTAQVYGTRTSTYRPQALVRSAIFYRDCLPYLQSIYGPLFGDGWPFLGDPRNPSKTARQILELPFAAIAVTSVTIDGLALDVDAYRLDGNWLVRVDGDLWPTTQNLVANPGDPNTWSVTFTRGLAVPISGQVAAQRLAIQWYLFLGGDPKCRLPFNVTQVTRAGVTISRDILKALKTSGVELADRWVASVNPQGLQRPPTVWSPDVPRNGRPYMGSGIPAR